MSKDHSNDDAEGTAGTAAAPAKSGKRKLFIAAGLATLLLGGGIAYATGVVGKMTGKSAHGEEPVMVGSVELPEIVANLNAGPRRSQFVRLKARLELTNKADETTVLAAQPRILDLFQTYLRDMRPEELRGSVGSYRLREELIARANIILVPARVTEILFIELLVQ